MFIKSNRRAAAAAVQTTSLSGRSQSVNDANTADDSISRTRACETHLRPRCGDR